MHKEDQHAKKRTGYWFSCASIRPYVYGVRGIWLPLLAGFLCVGFAGLDEYHQSFVAGRGPSVRDVGIDSIGIFIGILMVQFFCFLGRITIFRPLAKEFCLW